MPHQIQGIFPLLKRIGPLVVFSTFTILLTYPVSLAPSAYVIGRPFDDAFEHIWYLHWYKTALLDLHTSPLFQPDIFYPNGWDLSFASLPPLFPTLLVPITAVWGPVATYNLALLVSTFLAAYGVYLLVRAMGGTFLGGVVAGLFYAFYPNRQVYMHGFLNHLLGSMWLPWMLYGVYQAAKQPQSRTRWLLLASTAYALSIGSSWQYVYISTFALLIFSLFYVLPAFKHDLRSWIKPLLLAAVPILVIVVPLLANGFAARERLGSAAEFSLADLTRTSVSLERFFVPSALNPLLSELLREPFPLRNGEDGVVTFGFTILILTIIHLGWQRPWSRQTWSLVTLSVAGLLLMVGPFLQWQGEPAIIQGPNLARFSEIFPELGLDQAGIRIPMPALLIYRFIPPMRSFHHFGRLGVVAACSFGILAGLGLSTLQRRVSERVGIAVGALFLLLLFELNTQPLPSVTAIAGMDRDVDRWLSAQAGRSVIMEYPLWYSSKAQSLYYTIAHRQKIVHGYSIISPEFQEMRSVLAGWPGEETLDFLEEKGVEYILVHVTDQEDDFENSTLPELQSVDRLEYVGRFSRHVSPESIPTFGAGHIRPMVEIMKETYVFRLVGDHAESGS